MGISSVLQWWEEWLLFISAIRRKYVISYWIIRSFTWLAYLGSDAIAIYALATLFNRQRKQDYAAANNRSILELVWAPILLMHLGGQDCITAYNAEDNELWRRQVLTAVSQITVAIYVFCKSWPSGGHRRVLLVSIMTFVPGVLKCLEKPWALKSASINNVSATRMLASSREDEINPLEEYVQRAKEIVDADGWQLAEALQGRQGNSDGEGQAQGDEEDPAVDEGDEEVPAVDEGDDEDSSPPSTLPLPLGICLPSQLFADLASPYPDRLVTLQSFWVLDKTEAYASLQVGVYGMFDLLYTNIKMISNLSTFLEEKHQQRITQLQIFSLCIRTSAYTLPFVAICLLPSSHTKAYDEIDVKVTFTLFYCTTVLEYYSLYITLVRQMSYRNSTWRDRKRSPSMVAQYSLVSFFARNQRHNTMMHVVNSIQCKDLLDKLWCMNPCHSSEEITALVIEHVKKGWEVEIHDAASYRKFNDQRGQWTLRANHQQHLGWSLRRPFDESVLLWHIATDVCFYTSSPHQDAASPPHHGRAAWCETSPHHEIAVRCREISQYMMYLLFINPEMLLAGTRRNLFTAAYDQLEEIFKGQNQCPNGMEIIGKLKSQQGSLSQERGGFFHDAMVLADALRSVGDEKKVWEVIEGLWVEMICFSVSRCLGYLHAKSLGAGGEFLTYVWLLLSHMGMETLPEKLQGVEMEGNTGAAPLFSGSVRIFRRTFSV